MFKYSKTNITKGKKRTGGQEVSYPELMASITMQVLWGLLVGGNSEDQLKGHWNLECEEQDDLEKDGKMKWNTIKM